MTVSRRHPLCATLFSILASTFASAQVLLPPSETRFSLGGSFVVSQPKEGFAQAIGNGYGGSGGVIYHLTRSGLLGLRFDVSGVQYGHEKKRVPLSGTIGSRILIDVNTNNSIIALALAP